MKGEIPQTVKEIALKNGCNHVVYLGLYDNYKAYGISLVDKNGFPVPTGLPEILLWNENEYKIIQGEEAFELLDFFD